MRFLTIFLFAISLLFAPVAANAGPSLVMDVGTGRVLYSEDAHEPWYPASLTKMMTAYLVFKAIRDGQTSLEARVRNTPTAQAQPASKIGLPANASMPMETALKALIVKSANDVAVMLAEHVSGSVDAFVAEMNRTALDLGMAGTNYVNPNGLPAVEQVTTARDQALLGRTILMEFPQYNELFGLQSFKLGNRNLRSHNGLLKTFEGADGMKTGFICASGYNVVASATRDNRRLIAVVMGAESGGERTETAANLLELGFQNAWINPLVSAGMISLVRVDRFMRMPQREGLPVHMGPVVCKRRYQGVSNPYMVDRQTRSLTAMAADVPVPFLRPGPLPVGMAVLSYAEVPAPAIRPGSGS